MKKVMKVNGAFLVAIIYMLICGVGVGHGQDLGSDTQTAQVEAKNVPSNEATEIQNLSQAVEKIKQLENQINATQLNTNYLWMMLAAILVFFMQAGFCLIELGFSRSKNCINIIMKNVLDFSGACLMYLLVGFGLMYGASYVGVFGTDHFFLSTAPETSDLWVFWMFQVVFIGTAATISSGAMAERTKFMGYLCFSIVLSGFIYPVLGHWAWGGAYEGSEGAQGWLAAMGFHDFAGASVVHGVGGACALAGVLVLGPRIGRFAEDGTPRMIVGHNIPMAALGMFILWFAWFGFNAGSTLSADVSMGRIAVNTAISAAAGAIFSMLSMWKIQGRPDVAITINGVLAGLVAITAACDTVTPGSAIIIGALAGLFTTFGAVALEAMKIDDVVGAVPVHLVNGIWGTMAVAIFNENGFSGKMLGVQTLGAFAMSIVAFIVAYIVFYLIDVTIGLRANEIEQEEGLDFHEHAANAYPDFSTTEQSL